jgi:hypothetical protein
LGWKILHKPLYQWVFMFLPKVSVLIRARVRNFISFLGQEVLCIVHLLPFKLFWPSSQVFHSVISLSSHLLMFSCSFCSMLLHSSIKVSHVFVFIFFHVASKLHHRGHLPNKLLSLSYSLFFSLSILFHL